MSSPIRFEVRGFSRRQAAVLIGGLIVFTVAAVGLLLTLTNRGRGSVAGTTPGSSTATLTPSPSPTSSPVLPPTATLTPSLTPTLEPYRYTVQEGETLYYIIQLFGYRDLAVVPEIIALNGMRDENDLKVDQVLLIPRQTPTPGPTFTPTSQAATGTTPEVPILTSTQQPSSGPTPDYTGCSPENRCISPDGQFWIHQVVEGETISTIASYYDAYVPDLYQDNGLNQNSFISVGQILKVRIRVTLTPTLTPTGGPDSTATPTPTLSPPALLAPANGAIIARHQVVALQWAANQPLPARGYYMVQIQNRDTDEIYRAITRSNVFRVPSSLQPGIGRSARYEWWVVIVDGSTESAAVISGQGNSWVFTWGP